MIFSHVLSITCQVDLDYYKSLFFLHVVLHIFQLFGLGIRDQVCISYQGCWAGSRELNYYLQPPPLVQINQSIPVNRQVYIEQVYRTGLSYHGKYRNYILSEFSDRKQEIYLTCVLTGYDSYILVPLFSFCPYPVGLDNFLSPLRIKLLLLIFSRPKTNGK